LGIAEMYPCFQEEESSRYSERFDGNIATPDETTLPDMDQVSATSCCFRIGLGSRALTLCLKDE